MEFPLSLPHSVSIRGTGIGCADEVEWRSFQATAGPNNRWIRWAIRCPEHARDLPGVKLSAHRSATSSPVAR